MNLAKITILTEAGKNIGFGHYTRCSSLYDELIDIGYESRFIIYENEYKVNNQNIISLNWLDSIQGLFPVSQNEIVVIDSYLATEEIYFKISNYFSKVVVIDDYNRISYPADILVNPNVYFYEMNYANQTAFCTGGKDYVIVRPELRNAKEEKNVNEYIQNVLITIGGSDYRNLLSGIVSIFDKQNRFKIRVIDPENKIKAGKNVEILPFQSGSQMLNEIQIADLVISACGQTLHELAVLHTPTIGISIDFDQEPNQNYYLSTGFLRHKNSWSDYNLFQKLESQIHEMDKLSIRSEIVKLSDGLVNKFGIINVVNSIVSDVVSKK